MADEVLPDDLLQCPVCKERLEPPVKLCVNGHGVCRLCKDRLRACPVCRAGFSTFRHIFFEQLVGFIPVPCLNRARGCSVTKQYTLISEHEGICDFALSRCLFPSCSHEETLSSKFQAHVSSRHQDLVQVIMEKRHYPQRAIIIEGFFSVGSLLRLDYRDRYFVAHAYYNESQSLFYFCVFFVGKKSDAAKWRYTLNLDQGNPSQCLSYSNLCVPYGLNKDQLIADPRCFTTRSQQLLVRKMSEINYSVQVEALS